MTIKSSMRPLSMAGDAIGIAALILAALFLIPLAPGMPQAGLDHSWQYALNVAVERGMIFGRDLIFTFGPLGSVYSKLYGPATDTLMMVASTLFACGFCLAVALALTPGRLLYAVLLPVLVAMGPLRDSVFLAAPFLLLFAVARTQVAPTDRFYLRPTPLIQACIAFIAVAISITPIVKGSFAGSVGATYAIAVVILAFRNKAAAVAFALLALAALCFAWTCTGQPLSALPNYFLAQAPIISGYTNAMSYSGRTWVPVLVASVSLVIVGYFHLAFGRGRGAIGAGATLGLALSLFIAFKAAMVRQDGHVLIATGVLLLITLAVTARSTVVPALLLWILVIVTWKSVGHSVLPIGYGYIRELVSASWTRTIDGLDTRLLSPGRLKEDYNQAVAKIRTDEPLPAAKGTVDIYPTELSSVFANGLEWNGRPILQSYSVYDRKLDRINADHLERAGADTIFFSLDPIDDRLAALDDSGSLIGLLSHYTAESYDGNYIHFKRHAGHTATAIEPNVLLARTAQLGESVTVPGDGPVWATIDVTPTLPGKLVSTVYKLPELEIELTLSSGQIERRRFIPAIGSTGFVLSPYLRRTDDVLALASGIPTVPTVVSFRITPQKTALWKNTYTVQFKRIDIDAQRSARGLLLVEPTAPTPQLTSPANSPAPICTIDLANHKPFVASDRIPVPGGVLALQGWSAPAASINAHSIQTYFVLHDTTGSRYFAVRPQSRPDVALALKRPELASSGFNATLDLGSASGPRTLQMLTVADGVAYQCPFEIPLD